jgi:transketolase
MLGFFEAQYARYRTSVLGRVPRIGIEPDIRQGWDDDIGEGGRFIGMTGFGASAPAEQLFTQFGKQRMLL